MGLGADVGTFNLVCCTRNEKNEFNYDREVNAFLEIPLEDRFVFQMMKSQNVPVYERAKKAYALGEKAVRIAYTLSQLELRRPMKDGCVNPKEKDAFEILKVMIHSLLEGNVKKDKDVLYYSVPANAINEETDADFHSAFLKSVLMSYKSEEGFSVDPHPINEGLALIYAELKSSNYTGLSGSFGSGMINVCYATFGIPVFKFALVNSGDWIDKMVAKATGESVAFVNHEKTKINLEADPTSSLERAIQMQYRIMIDKTVQGIKQGVLSVGKKAKAEAPIDFVIAGGACSPVGFESLFRDAIQKEDLPLEIGKIIKPADPLLSVAKGCLIAAESSLQ